MPLPYLLPTGPAAFVTLDTCAHLPAHCPAVPRPQAGAGPFVCPHPCAHAGTPACRLATLAPVAGPPRLRRYDGPLYLRETAAALVASAQQRACAAGGPTRVAGGVRVRPAAGLIGASAATALMNATDEVASTVDKKKGKPAVPRIQSLADLVDSLAAQGQVAPAAVAPLHAAIDQLLRVLEQGD